MKMKKVVLSAVCAGALVVGTIAGTMAYLTDTTQTVSNTFTVGDVELELTETKGPDFKVSPGVDVDKDPVVTVLAKSDKCYVFVEVVDTLDANLTYAMDANWVFYKNTANKTGIWYYKTPVDAAGGEVKLPVIADNKVYVNEALANDVNDTVDTKKLGKLEFVAYAVQADGFDGPEHAWNSTFNK